MRNLIFMRRMLVVIGFVMAALSPAHVSAEDTSKATKFSPPHLSQAVLDVLKLTRSQIGDDTVVASVNNSSASYTLGASEVIYLREQGVTDRVITAMLNHRNQTPAAATVAPAKASSVWADSVPATRTVVTTAPAYVQPAPVYVAPAPVYSYYYPSYHPRHAYGYPYYSPLSISLGFGFGFGGHHRGGFHVGYR